MTRGTINNIILRNKPAKENIYLEDPIVQKSIVEVEENLDYLYYYGILMMKNTVVTIFKNN